MASFLLRISSLSSSLVNFLKTDAMDGIGETFPFLALFCKEEDGLLKGSQNFFLGCENLRNPLAHSYFLPQRPPMTME